MANYEPVMFLYPTEVIDEFEKETGTELSPAARRWVEQLDKVVLAFDEKGREDRQAGRPAADKECFLVWAAKQFGQNDAGPIAELVQDYYMDAYNSGLSVRRNAR